MTTKRVSTFLGMAIVALVIAAAPAAHADPAIVIKDIGGFLPGVGANGDLFGASGGFGAGKNVRNGNVIVLTFRAQVTNLSGKAAVFKGIGCDVEFGTGRPPISTTDTHYTVSASGQATLICKYKLP